MDTNASPVKEASRMLLRNGIRQHRHILKKAHWLPYCHCHASKKSFGIDDWLRVEWACSVLDESPHHGQFFCEIRAVQFTRLYKPLLILKLLQKISDINKVNRSKVSYHHRTGSCSYEVHLQNMVSLDLSVQLRTVMDVSIYGYISFGQCMGYMILLITLTAFVCTWL